MMSSSKHKLRLIGAFAALGVLVLAVACRGFFVNPTLSSLAVGPASPTIETGNTDNTVQMTAVGTYNDGSTGNPSVAWTITPESVATISSSGLVTSVSIGSATVTASANSNPAITGTQTVSVTVGCIDSISLSPTNYDLNSSVDSVSITATAQTCNGSQNITDVATWSSSNTSVATVADGVVTAVGTTGADGTVIITASSGGITSDSATIVVSGF